MAKRRRGARARARSASAKEPEGTAAPPPTLPPWSRWVALALLMGVHATLLAGVFNPAPHSGGDNAAYLSLAFSMLDRGEYLDLYDPSAPAHTKYPPGFPLLLAGAMLFGARTWAQFKVLSAVAIFATVGLSVAWAWRRRGWQFAICVGAILAFANAFLYASQWILSDPMFLVLTIGALVAFDASDPEGRDPEVDGVGPDRTSRAWLVLGLLATVAAFFTRSAGLPLVVAVAGWLLWKRRFRSVTGFGVLLGIPAVLWWLRDRALGGPGYTGEFWMINPYQPDLGRAGVVDLLGRIATNATRYFGAHIPTGFVGATGTTVALLGVVLLGLAGFGWIRRMRNPGVAELFVPLYTGLILLWPEVWSGDRFALPLFPPLIFYAAETVSALTRSLPKPGHVALVGTALLVMLVPSARSWNTSVGQAELCRARAPQGPFACYGPRMQEFVAAAMWTKENLDESAVVITRKPRMFYALSGTPSIVFPFSTEPETLLAAAESAQARYVVIDYLDNLASFYLIPILEQRSGAFCTVRSFGGDDRGIATELLGFRTTERGEVAAREGEAGTRNLSLARCPEAMLGGRDSQPPASSADPGVVPLLARLDS